MKIFWSYAEILMGYELIYVTEKKDEGNKIQNYKMIGPCEQAEWTEAKTRLGF